MTTTSTVGGEIGILIIFFTLVFMQWNRKLPSPDELGHYLESINTKGGNIFLLFSGTIFCAWITGKFIYHLIDLQVAHQLDPTNAVAMVGLSFFTTTLTGGFGAVLFKTMTGEGPAQSSMPVATLPPPSSPASAPAPSPSPEPPAPTEDKQKAAAAAA